VRTPRSTPPVAVGRFGPPSPRSKVLPAPSKRKPQFLTAIRRAFSGLGRARPHRNHRLFVDLWLAMVGRFLRYNTFPNRILGSVRNSMKVLSHPTEGFR